MHHAATRLLLCLAALLAATSASAQVDVTASAGTPAASYTTLKGAFDAINAGTHQGVIGIAMSGDTTETASAVLNASGSGAALYTSIGISPTGGAARTISGAIAAGSPLIDLNGADNVTIDGLNAGGNSLTIANTTVSATSGTSTIRFQADATSNTITNASILGSSTMATTTNGGNIWFGAAAVTSGSDNNTISNCNIGPAGANLPTKAIYGNGSTTTTSTYNSGITITGNNIFDFFNPAAQSNGLYIGNGNSDWIISNNRFYQTATRTHTTASLHAAIQIAGATGNNNHLISGNTIGFASAAGTGTYTLVGNGVGSKFLGIYFSSAGTSAASSIQGNTITAINLSGIVGGTSTAGAFVGISISSGVANIGNLTGNTVGSATTPSAISVTSNNASAMEAFGIYYFPSAVANVSNNTVAGMTVSNSGAGSLVLYGIRAFTGSAVVNTMQNNVVGTAAAPISNSSSSTASRTIGLYCQTGACIATGNTIGSLSMNAPNVGTGSSASLIGLWIDNTGATSGNNVAQNTVRSLSNTSAAAAVWVTGLHYNGATTGTHTVQRNFIHSLSTPSTSATATVNGINVQGGLTSYQNNMVVLGSDMTANSPQINGINETIAGTDSFYHNSVYVGGSAVAAGTANSFAFQSSITLNTRNYRDNIFYNARSNGSATGKHYAMRVGGTAPNPAGLTSNNNVLLANGSGGFTGLFNLVDQATLANWQGATGQDASSFALDPQYVAPTAATPDLHINPSVITPIEGNGFAIGSVADDFDGQPRASLTPTDIGADAGNFLGADFAPPAISYTPLANTSVTGNRTLTATLVDVSGVATGGLAPRIYYRKNAGAYFSQACSLTGGTVNNGTWDCVVNHADLGGVALADAIAYFVIAQDTAIPPNVGSNPGGAVASDVNTVTTPPASPNTYTIVAAYSGSYDVGVGQTYTSLTNAGGVFEALNAGALTGNVLLNITSDLAGELGTNGLNQWPEDGLGGYTLLIKPSGAPRTITGTNTGALIRLNGADRVRIDGSTAATFADAVGGNPALRELTIQNTNTGTSAVVIAIQSGAAGAQNDTLKNLNVLGQDPTTTLGGIVMGGNTPGTAGTDNDGNRVENCTVKRTIYGIYSAGQNALNPNTGTVITQNDLSATGADRVRRIGIVVFNEDGVQISENSVGGIDTSESADAIGIGVGTQAVDNAAVTSGGVTSALVSRNKINGINSASAVGFSAAGIAVAGAPGGANRIVDNMISGVISPATSPDIVAGIFVAGAAGANTRLLYNSVAMTGDRGVVASQAPSYAVAISGVDPVVESKDNIFYTTQTSGGGAAAKSYAIGMATTAFANFDSNFNDFNSSGANAGFFRSGSLTGGAGTDYPNLAAWAAAVSDDLNSLELDPLFTSTTDLHLQVTSPVGDLGTPIAGVLVDFDGQPRSPTTPDIGADELDVPADLAITKTDGVTTASPGASVTYTITASNLGAGGVSGATVADTFPATLVCTWTCVGAGGGTCTASGAGNINDSVDLPNGASVTYTASCGIAAAATGSLANTATVSSVVSDPVPGNNSATDTDTLVPSADAAITKTDGVTTAAPGGSVTYTIVAANAGPSNTTGTVADTFPASLTCTWVCVGAGGGTCTASGAGNINDSVNLPAGGSTTYTASCTIAASATGSLSNTATVGTAATDPTPGNNSATDTDTLVPSADAAITKTNGLGTSTPGQGTTYTITASNAGPSDTTGTLADTFPASLTGCTWTCVGAGGGTCTATGSGNINDSVTLPAGGSATYTATCTIAPSATGTLSNTATVSTAATDPTPGNNSATDSDTLTPSADLQLSLSDGPDPIGVHRDLTYTATIQNAGPSDAASITFTDTLPAGTTFVSSTPGSPTCTHAAGVVTCNLGGLAGLSGEGGGQTTVTIVATTDAPGSPSDTGSVSASTSDPTPGNNSASTSTLVRFLKGDLDNDLNTELYLRNLTSNANQVWLMNGVVQSSAPATNPATPASATQTVAGVDDFDGDYRNDLVFWDTAAGTVEFWLMNGVNRLGAPVPLTGAGPLAPNWKLSATADFNHDNKPDVVWRNQISQKIVIWTMNGTVKQGALIPTPDLAVNSNWEIVAALDLNADNNTDFLWYNSTSGKIVYWWMDASVVRITGNFTVPDAAGNNNWKVLAGGDYGTGSGGSPNTNDIVWRNATSGKFVVWYMDTAGNRTFGTFTTPDQPSGTPTDWVVVGPR